MSTSRDVPNPLRPYYRPPSIGIPQDTPGTTSSGTHGLGPKNGSAASYASSARDMFDYSDYLSDAPPSSVEAVKKTLDDWVYKYFSILLAQPFDVAKTILQVRRQGVADGAIPAEEIRASNYRDSAYSDYPSDDSDPDEPAYFTSSAPNAHSYSPSRSRRRRASEREPSPAAQGIQIPPHQLSLKRVDSIMEVISQEWNKEGAWGVWKASNATFVYSLLLQTIEQWSRGLFSAAFNVPEAAVTSGLNVSAELVDSPYPWASLAVAVAAAVSAGLILAPLDLIRTKLILTPLNSTKRSLSHNLRHLPSYICPTSLMAPTILHSLITPTINHSTPLLLRSRLGIDPVLTPTTYSISKFLSQTTELFLKLPLETVLRRGQMAVLASPTYHAEGRKHFETVVEIGPYHGVVGTMWSIVREEGTSSSHESAAGPGGIRAAKKGKKAETKGQGVQGLWRGWRVGMWGLAGMWCAKSLGGSGGNGGEF
ncbi:Mitochondrial fusion and transport protein ugo1 [Lachnellula suecica]|uniref:Mitochondrial fusion and transport protein ugo1 n=1 Tax=Lachnellula suecica TaxID=602035 RepID=A0A8T9CDZ4_9HELO|nr:Mitochondrial fusion and transport protein ugo1 [Lachnellula suecica]